MAFLQPYNCIFLHKSVNKWQKKHKLNYTTNLPQRWFKNWWWISDSTLVIKMSEQLHTLKALWVGADDSNGIPLCMPNAPTLKLTTGVERAQMEGSPPQSSSEMASAQICCCFPWGVTGTGKLGSWLQRWQRPCGNGSWDLLSCFPGLGQVRRRGKISLRSWLWKEGGG